MIAGASLGTIVGDSAPKGLVTQGQEGLGGEYKAQSPVANYAQGFEGASMAPFPAEALKVLGAPVNPEEVEIKPNGIVFLPGVSYRRILTRAFGAGAWALLPRGPARTMGNEVVYHGALYILGRFVSEAVGECASNNGGMSYASALEGARTDCLTRCCKDLGVATELWDPEWRTAWQAKFCTKEFKDGKAKWSKVSTGGGEPTGRNVGGPAQDLEATLKASLDVVKDADGKPIVVGTSPPDSLPFSKASLEVTARPKEEIVAMSPVSGAASLTPTTDAPAESGGLRMIDDTGEAPTASQLDAVRTAVRALKWSKAKAGGWFKQNFGVMFDGLTADQCASALALLQAAALDDGDAAYSAIYDRLKAAGKVL